MIMKCRLRILILIPLLALCFAGFTQPVQGSATLASDHKTLLYPWAGGLNACQFCSIDLNLDGTPDLLIFDRQGNRRLTFIASKINGNISYAFSPEFALKLPILHDWVQAVDYNHDGKMDLFTYGNGGIRVFRNVSDTALKFALVTDLLQSYYYTGYVGILVTSVDYPAIADIDGDGDLDLLTFFGLGSYVEYHKNQSFEKYGNYDSLDYKLSDHCWGKFKESESGNRITLNAVCPYMEEPLTSRPSNDRHTGSTLLATDLNKNGLQDLLLGDYDYPGITALFNGGTTDTAFMVAQDTLFPAGSKAISLFSFPVVSQVDINQDGLKDLVVSPFDPNLYNAENYNCTWFYKNTGTPEVPHYSYVTDRLFREDMMDFGSCSHPVLFDFDHDGLTDLFVGNDGYYDSSWYQTGIMKSHYTSRISYFRNTGTATEPVFTNITDDFAGLSGLYLRGLYPAFSDVNGDGRTDLVVGNSDGKLILLVQKPGTGNVPQFGPPVTNWQNIDVGDYSTPQFFDVDNDQKPELFIGERNGNLNYYKISGSGSSEGYKLVTDSLGKINVTNYNLSYYGYSVPDLFTGQPGHTSLLVGSDEGRIWLYQNIDNNLNGKFVPADTLYQWISSTPDDTIFGWQTSPAMAHLTDPAGFDLITGNFSGGLNYLTKRTQATIVPGVEEKPVRKYPQFTLVPNPADQFTTIHFQERISPEAQGIISDVFGNTISTFTLGRSLKISTAGFPNGLYIIHFGGSSAKLIVIH